MKKNKERLHDLCYIENRTDLQITEVPGGEKGEEAEKHILGVMSENFPNQGCYLNI